MPVTSPFRNIALASLFAIAMASASLSTARGAEETEEPSSSLELVDPHVFRVCADPRNLPFSNEAGEGFENKLSDLFAKKLDKKVAYAWYPGATGFVRNTLNAHKCDVIMGFPQGNDFAQVTNPYYRTAYALVFKPGSDLRGVEFVGQSDLEDKADRHRGRDPARDLHGQEGVIGKGEILSADDRHTLQFDVPRND